MAKKVIIVDDIDGTESDGIVRNGSVSVPTSTRSTCARRTC